MTETLEVGASGVAHAQVKFQTKQIQYSVAETPFSLPASIEPSDLSKLINGLLKEKREIAAAAAAAASEDGHAGVDSGVVRDAVEQEWKNVEFDFLLSGDLLRVPLNQLVVEKGISSETVIDLEYVEKYPSPKPEDSLIHDDWVAAVAGLKGYILSGCYDNTVNIWNTEGEKLLTIPGHSGPVKSVAWVHVGDDTSSSFISGSHDQTLIIWALDFSQKSVERMHVCRGHAGSVDAVCLSPDKSRFISGSWDKSLKLWSTSLEPEPGTTEESTGTSKKAKRLKETSTEELDGGGGGGGGEGRLHTRTPLLTLAGHNEGVSSLQWLEEKKVASASWDHTIKIWDIETTREEKLIQGNKVFIDISYSPLNRLIAAGSCDRHVRIYDPRSQEGSIVKSSMTHHTGWVSSVAWSPTNENLLLSGSYDAVAKLWDLRSASAPLYNLSGHEEKILAADWTIPDLMLTGGADNHLKIFRTQ